MEKTVFSWRGGLRMTCFLGPLGMMCWFLRPQLELPWLVFEISWKFSIPGLSCCQIHPLLSFYWMGWPCHLMESFTSHVCGRVRYTRLMKQLANRMDMSGTNPSPPTTVQQPLLSN
jgi:hypothetical protein